MRKAIINITTYFDNPNLAVKNNKATSNGLAEMIEYIIGILGTLKLCSILLIIISREFEIVYFPSLIVFLKKILLHHK